MTPAAWVTDPGRPPVRSRNYVTGRAGWSITADGETEYNGDAP